MFYNNSASEFPSVYQQNERWKCLLYSSEIDRNESSVSILKNRSGEPNWLIFDPNVVQPVEVHSEVDDL